MATLASPSSFPLLPVEIAPDVELHCFTFGDRRAVLDAMLKSMNQSGCWLESRGALSSSQIELCFVAMLGAIEDLYAGLIGAGIEMSSDNHRALTWFCTLRRHRKAAADALRTINIRMEIQFMNEPQEEMGFVAEGTA